MEYRVPSGDGAREVFPPRQADVQPQSEREEIGELDDAERAHSHAEAEEAAHVGEEVDDAEELRPLLPHEVQRLEVDVDHGQVVGHVGVVDVVGSFGWETRVNTRISGMGAFTYDVSIFSGLFEPLLHPTADVIFIRPICQDMAHQASQGASPDIAPCASCSA